jgi:hypothetical protein
MGASVTLTVTNSGADPDTNTVALQDNDGGPRESDMGMCYHCELTLTQRNETLRPIA